MKQITVLGSTGSVGTQALDVVRQEGYTLYGICANRSVDALEAQIREFSPKVCVALDEAAAKDLRVRVADTQTKVLAGAQAIEEMASAPEAEMVLNSMMGSAGLRPTLCAIRAGKNVALANKETLVTAGEIVMREALNEFLAALPTRERKIFVRRYWYMSNISGIARDLGMSESNVKVTLMRTRDKLREHLEQKGIKL